MINPGTIDDDGIIAALASIGGSATTLTSGRKAVAVTNTAVALGSGSCKVVFITAFAENSDVVVIGGSDAVYSPVGSRLGKILYPGDSITLSIDNLSKIYVNGTANDGVTFAYTA